MLPWIITFAIILILYVGVWRNKEEGPDAGPSHEPGESQEPESDASATGSPNGPAWDTNGVGIVCPHCEVRNITVAKKAWFLQGFIIFIRYGSRRFVGCTECVDRELWSTFRQNLFLGWWSALFFAVPIVLLQNAAQVLRDDWAFQSELEDVLAEIGIQYEDVVLDERGFTQEQRDMLQAAYSILSQSIWADSAADERELRKAAEIVEHLTGGQVSKNEARQTLENDRFESVNPAQFTAEYRVSLLRAALAVTVADQRLASDEIQFLHQLGDQLGISQQYVEELIGAFTGVGSQTTSKQKTSKSHRACEILGVSPDASPTEIKKQYRSLMLKFHPDKADNDEKREVHNERAKKINWAYEYLLGVS